MLVFKVAILCVCVCVCEMLVFKVAILCVCVCVGGWGCGGVCDSSVVVIVHVVCEGGSVDVLVRFVWRSLGVGMGVLGWGWVFVSWCGWVGE